LTKRTFIQLSITTGALLIAAAHLIWPVLNIDGFILGLIIIAIVPWVAPLFKSLELPGGLKFEFQDLQKVSKEAKESGLLTDEVQLQKEQDYSFVSVANVDPNLALAGLRIEIEKRLRNLASENKIETSRKGIRALINELSENQLLTTKERSTLEDMITTLNAAAHGENFDLRVADWVIQDGPRILASLDGKIQKWVEARCSSLPHNMNAWGHEKSESVLKNLSNLVDTIKTDYGDNPVLSEKLLEHIYPIIWNASKLYAFFNDTDWQPEDRDVIVSEGRAGFEKLKHRYNRA